MNGFKSSLPHTPIFSTEKTPLGIGLIYDHFREAFFTIIISSSTFPHLTDQNRQPDFVGAPYEFWVGSDAPLGTSIGQIRVDGNVEKEKVMYDLLHGYHEGGALPV